MTHLLSLITPPPRRSGRRPHAPRAGCFASQRAAARGAALRFPAALSAARACPGIKIRLMTNSHKSGTKIRLMRNSHKSGTKIRLMTNSHKLGTKIRLMTNSHKPRHKSQDAQEASQGYTSGWRRARERIERHSRRAVRGCALPPPLPRTKWTRRVPHPVLIGHAASLTPYQSDTPRPSPGRRAAR